MQTVADRPEAPTAIRTDLGADLCLIWNSVDRHGSSSLCAGGEKMSKQVVRGGDVAGLLERFARLRAKARGEDQAASAAGSTIQEAGLDGSILDRSRAAE